MTRATTTLAGPCTGARRRDFLLGLRHGQLVGAHVPSWCSGHGVDAGCSRRAGPPGQLTARSDQTPPEGTGRVPRRAQRRVIPAFAGTSLVLLPDTSLISEPDLDRLAASLSLCD